MLAALCSIYSCEVLSVEDHGDPDARGPEAEGTCRVFECEWAGAAPVVGQVWDSCKPGLFADAVADPGVPA